MRASHTPQHEQEIQQLNKRREELHDQSDHIWHEIHKLQLRAIGQEFEAAPGYLAETRQEIARLQKEHAVVKQEYRQADDLYWETLMNLEELFQRPTEGFMGILSRFLGPTPRLMPRVDPSPEKLATVHSYRLSGFFLFLGAIATLVGLAFIAPWLVVSPAILLFELYEHFLPTWAAVVLTLVSGYYFIRQLSKGVVVNRYDGRFFDVAAMREEQWFRAGAESWSTWQRIYSCVAFGAVHIVNFVYPMASLIVVGAVGGVFMATYLREYRRSGSYENALLASTKLHAAYNRFAIAYLAVVVCLIVVVGLA